MAAMILNSSRAVEMSVYVVRAFVQLRELLASNKELAMRLDDLEARIARKLTTHDEAITGILKNPPRANEPARAEAATDWIRRVRREEVTLLARVA